VIIELETLRYRPGSERGVVSAFGDAVAAGASPSPLLGFWTVDIGPLNSAVLLWPFADAAAREEALVARAASAAWPPDTGGALNSSESLVLEPAPFNEPLEGRTGGAVYEIRTYDYQPGTIGTVIERWAPMIDGRRAISPLIGCFFASGETSDKWVHIWSYAEASERTRARGEAARQGIWPPPTAELLIQQDSRFVLPAAFSPLH
jgi:hypothetical protein